MNQNALSNLIDLVLGLQKAGVTHNLDCCRDAIVVTIPGPSRYVEIEFFAHGHVEVQSFGPPSSEVVTTTHDELFRLIVESVETREGADPSDALFEK